MATSSDAPRATQKKGPLVWPSMAGFGAALSKYFTRPMTEPNKTHKETFRSDSNSTPGEEGSTHAPSGDAEEIENSTDASPNASANNTPENKPANAPNSPTTVAIMASQEFQIAQQESRQLSEALLMRKCERNLIQVREFFARSQFEDETFDKLVSYKDDCYNRVLVYRDDFLEILLLCWKPGQATPIHGHPDDGCLVKVLQGALHETQYEYKDSNRCPDKFETVFDKELVKVVGEEVLNSYETDKTGFATGADGLHVMHNKSESECVVSLHVYSPPAMLPDMCYKCDRREQAW